MGRRDNDPSKLSRRSSDVGTRTGRPSSTHSPGQKKPAEDVIAQFPGDSVYGIGSSRDCAASGFHPAEEYHQTCFARNTSQPVCQHFVTSEVSDIRKQFMQRLQKQKA